MKRVAGTDLFEPGVIYELRCCIDSVWHAFYVGETTNVQARKSQHVSASKSDTRLVYQFIRETLEPNNIAWDLFPVHDYGAEGPTDLEHEHIMTLLYDGVRLKNMKKGSDVWMQQQIAIAEDMRGRGIRSYRKYQHTLSLEAQERVAAAKQAKWIEEQQRSQLKYDPMFESIKQKYLVSVSSSQRSSNIIQQIQQERTVINAQEEELKKHKNEREAKKALDLAEIRARQQAAWEAERARQIEAADRERARQRKETLAQTFATAAEEARQAALATARAEAFAQAWPEHQARLDAREQLKAELAQSKRDNARYMRELERKSK